MASEAKAVWTGYISFGMISVPVKIFAAARDEKTAFKQVHVCATGNIAAVKQFNVCSGCNTTVTKEDISKGIELSKDVFAVVNDEELAALTPTKSNVMEIEQFVQLNEIDPIFFDLSYFIVPEPAGRKAYELLYQTMGKSGLAGRTKLVNRGKEYNVFIRVYGKGLMLHTVFSDAEVRTLSEYGTTGNIEVNATELRLAKNLLSAMVVPFDRTSLINEYDTHVAALVESKRAAEEMPIPSVDLVKSLQASLKNAPKTKKAGA